MMPFGKALITLLLTIMPKSMSMPQALANFRLATSASRSRRFSTVCSGVFGQAACIISIVVGLVMIASIVKAVANRRKLSAATGPLPKKTTERFVMLTPQSLVVGNIFFIVELLQHAVVF